MPWAGFAMHVCTLASAGSHARTGHRHARTGHHYARTGHLHARTVHRHARMSILL